MNQKITFVCTAAIEIENTDGRTLSFTLPEGCSVPEEFKVGDEVALMIYPRGLWFNKTSYCEIKHAASKKTIKAFYKIGKLK